MMALCDDIIHGGDMNSPESWSWIARGHRAGDHRAGVANPWLTVMVAAGDFLYSLGRERVKRLLLGGAHLLQEGCKVESYILTVPAVEGAWIPSARTYYLLIFASALML
jgi:hypothetical protein